MNIIPVYGNKDVLIPASRCNRQLTSAADASREKVRMKGGESREVGSRESQREGMKEGRDERAKRGEGKERLEGWDFSRAEISQTRSRWPREVDKDWGGLRRRMLVVRPRIWMYQRRMALKRGSVGRGAKSARDISSEGGVFKIRDRGNGGVDREGSVRW